MLASRDRCSSLPGLVYKNSTPVRTGHVWTGKISFVRVLDTVAGFKGGYVFHINRPV